VWESRGGLGERVVWECDRGERVCHNISPTLIISTFSVSRIRITGKFWLANAIFVLLQITLMSGISTRLSQRADASAKRRAHDKSEVECASKAGSLLSMTLFAVQAAESQLDGALAAAQLLASPNRMASS
jgi:hypothetical protein